MTLRGPSEMTAEGRCFASNMFVSLARLCVVYVVKEVASFPGGSVN